MNIRLNISGRNFEVSKDILFKIPYFANGLADCDESLNKTIFVARSDHIFKHVLAYMIDPLYPFPKKYEFELKFYGIEYDKLYDENEEIMDELIKLRDNNDQINSELTKLQRKIKKMKEKLPTSSNVEQECYRCDKIAVDDKNYCYVCNERGIKCNKRGCQECRYGDHEYCHKHY